MKRALILLLTASCYNPSFPEGVLCSVEGQCPEGQMCATDGRCYSPGHVPDAGASDTDAPDADIGPHAVGVAAGDLSTCAILNGGEVRCWGNNDFGQLGIGTTAPFGDNEPASAAPLAKLDGSVKALGFGLLHACAVFDDDSLQCWGFNDHGELGQANQEKLGDDEAPSTAPKIELGGGAAEACGGDGFTCARLLNGQVRCFGLALGRGILGLPGVDSIGSSDKPMQFPSIDFGTSPITDIDCGLSHACAVNQAGSVFCWGQASDGALGYPGTTNVGDDETPAEAGAVQVGATAVQVAVGGRLSSGVESHSCALLSTGKVRCWGAGAALGYGDGNVIGDDEPPSQAGFVDLGGAKAMELVANGGITCARLENGDVRCWGFPNGHSADPVGDNEEPSLFPALPLPAPAISISAGYEHICALLETHDVYCWGRGADGRLGYGDEEDVGIGTLVNSRGPVPVIVE